MKEIRLALLGFSLLSAPLAATAQFTYTTNDGTITITEYTGAGGALTIPGTINGLPVAGIGSYWLTQYVEGAVSTVDWFLAGAFYDSSITSVAVPDSVTNIAPGAFSPCADLSAITVDAANPAYGSVGGGLVRQKANRPHPMSRGHSRSLRDPQQRHQHRGLGLH